MADQLEHNKSVARGLLDLAFNQQQPEAAVQQYMGKEYRQHNPQAGDGAEPFIAYVHYFVGANPNARMAFKRVIAEGDLVVVHSHLVPEPGSRGTAVVDIFRLADGRVVEHWDVLQEVPETAANNNTMF